MEVVEALFYVFCIIIALLDCIIGHVPQIYVPCMTLDWVDVMVGLCACAFIIIIITVMQGI